MLPGLAWGPPPPGGPKQPNEAPAPQQANAAAGQALLALCWRLSCAGGPPNDPLQPKNEPLRFSSGSRVETAQLQLQSDQKAFRTTS